MGWLCLLVALGPVCERVIGQPNGFLWEQIPRPAFPEETSIRNPELHHYFDLNDRVGDGSRSAQFPIKEIDIYPSNELLATFDPKTDRLGEVFEVPQRPGSPRLALRARAYIRPPLSGTYFFALASDDGGVLYLNPNGEAVDSVEILSQVKLTRVRTFDELDEPFQRKEPVVLNRGTRYFVEVIVFNSNNGNTHMSVQWARPDGVTELVPIEFLDPYPSEFAVAIEEPIVPAFLPSGVESNVSVAIDGPLGLIDSMALLVDGEEVNRLGREAFDDPYDRFDLGGTVAISWPDPGVGKHDISISLVDVLGNKTSSLDREVTVTRDCSGLIGEYFSSVEPEGDQRIEAQIDANIDFRWGVPLGAETIYTSPPFLPSEAYSVRWTGFLRSGVAGTYQMKTSSDDAARVWVDGTLVVDDWDPAGVSEDVGEVMLEEARFYSVRIEFRHLSGRASEMKWFWTEPGGEETVVPANRLFYCEPRRPIVRLTKPFNRERLPLGTSVFMSAEAESFASTVEAVEFFVDGERVSRSPFVAGFPFSGFWNGASEGTHEVTAVAIDAEGRAMESVIHTVEVTADLPACLDDVYRSDFETGVGDEWLNPRLSATPKGGRQFLGPFEDERIQLSLSDLDNHSDILIEFDLYVLRSWDGNGGVDGFREESWELRLGDGRKFSYTFSNLLEPEGLSQSYPDLIGEGIPHKPRSGGVGNPNELGYFYGSGSVPTVPMDQVYRIRLPVLPHSGSNLVLLFSGIGLRGLADEGWGIDNLVIKTLETTEPPQFVTALTDRAVLEGDTVRFSVAAEGQGRLAYRWEKDGVLIPGENGASLTLQGVEVSTGGQYTVSVSNCSGEVASSALLSVAIPNRPPEILGLAGSISIREDVGQVQFPFEVQDPEDPPSQLEFQISVGVDGPFGIEDISISGTGRDRVLTLAPKADLFGKSEVFVEVRDTEGLSSVQRILVDLLPVNDSPTIDPIADVIVTEGDPFPEVNVTGIGSGAFNEIDPVILVVEVSNPELFARFGTIYESPADRGVVDLVPAPGRFGQSKVRVTVNDGRAENSGRTESFSVTIEQRPNLLPSIVLVTEPRGEALTTDDRLLVEFVAEDLDGEIVAVHLEQDGQVQETLASPPYRFDWRPPAEGVFVLRGTVTDDREGVGVSEELTVAVRKPNTAPYLGTLIPVAVDEDSGVFSVPLITRDDYTPLAQLEWRVQVADPSLIQEGVVVFDEAVARWELVFSTLKDQFGDTVVTVRAIDSEMLFTERSFPLFINGINDEPTLDPIADVVLLGGVEVEAVELRGIGSGAANEDQILEINAVSSQPGLIPDPVIQYTSPAPTGVLTLRAVTGQFGEAEVTVTVRDGDTRSEGVTQQFKVSVERLPNVLPTVSISRERAGMPVTEGDTVRVTLLPNDPDGRVVSVQLLANGVELGSATEGPFVFEWQPDSLGLQRLQGRVVDDRGGVGLSVPLEVTVIKRNEGPILSELEPVVLEEDFGEQQVDLVIEDDLTPVEELLVTVGVDGVGVIAGDRVDVAWVEDRWVMTLRSAADAFGGVSLQIHVTDGSGASVSQTVSLLIIPINDPPTLDPIADLRVIENSAEVLVDVTGISQGGQGELGPLVVSARSDQPDLVAHPAVEYRSPESSATLRIQPLPDRVGESLITVAVNDGESLNGTVVQTFRVVVEALPNLAPEISLVEPRVGDSFLTTDPIRLVANASDSDGQVDRVEFVVNERNVGTDPSAPFEWVLADSPPGEYQVRAIAFDDEGARAMSNRVSYSVVLPPPRLGIQLVAPLDRGVFCPDTSIRFRAEIVGPVESIERVEFFAGETRLGTVTEGPYEFSWEEPVVGDFFVFARMVLSDGETIDSDAASIAVSENCGDVIVVQAGVSAEAERLREYLFEMGLGAAIINQEQLTNDTFASFQLVILHVAEAHAVQEATIQRLTDLAQQGRPGDGLPVPIYFIGDHLGSEAGTLSASSQAQWKALVGLQSGGGGVSGGQIEIVETPDSFEFTSGRFGELEPFSYDLSLESGLAVGDVDIVAFNGGSDLAVVYPPFSNFDPIVARRVSQNFFVVDGGEAVSLLERKRFFQNAVCWLLRCSRCTNVDLPIQMIEVPSVIELGTPSEVTIRLVNNGACEATAAQVLGSLPPGLQVNEVGFNQGLDWDYDVNSGNLRINLGRVGRGDPAAVDVKIGLRSVLPGTMSWELCSRSNNTVDSCQDLEIVVEGVLPPELQLNRIGTLEFELKLVAGPGPRYVIQASNDLRTWVDIVTTSDAEWKRRFDFSGDADGRGRYFRVRVGR